MPDPVADVRPGRPAGLAPRAAQDAPEAQSDALSEATLIRRARSLLTTAPAQAESVLAQHRRDYPDGVLAQERDALAIEVRIALGDREGAFRKLSRFERTYPASAHRERIRQALGQTP